MEMAGGGRGELVKPRQGLGDQGWFGQPVEWRYGSEAVGV